MSKIRVKIWCNSSTDESKLDIQSKSKMERKIYLAESCNDYSSDFSCCNARFCGIGFNDK